MKVRWAGLSTCSVMFARTVPLFPLASALSFSTSVTTRAWKYGVSFSPAGLLTPFHVGASECLNELGLLTDDVALSGSSGGALAAVTSAMINHPSRGQLSLTSLEASVYVAQQCRDFGSLGVMRKALDEILARMLPDDAHEYINRRPAELRVAYTTLSMTGWKGHVASSFTSKSDLVDCLRASCNIPFYFNYPNVFVEVRGERAIDGFFAVDYRRFGCLPTQATTHELIISVFSAPTVKIDPYAMHTEGSKCTYDIISPRLIPPELRRKLWPKSTKEFIQMALAPPRSILQPDQPISDDELRERYQNVRDAGYEAVKAWYEQTGRHKPWQR